MEATIRKWSNRCAAAVCAALLLSGCGWIGLARGARDYPTTQPGQAANVVTSGDWAYFTRGAAGIEILHLASRESTLMPLPRGVDSADDLALADGLLFVLDAFPPGHLSVFSLATPSEPFLVGTPAPVDVGPFSGVSAAAGNVVVSGGTSHLSLRRYDSAGRLNTEVASADYGRGQPDVTLDPHGALALVSTHDWGPYFHLTVAHVTKHPLAVTKQGALALDTYGFTPGGAKPANFPIESAVAGSRAVVAFRRGIVVLDVGVARAPRQLGQLGLDIEPVNVDMRDGIAALVGSEPRPMLVFVDVRDAARPKVLQSFSLPEGSLATGVALTSSYAVVAAHARGGLLFDRSKGEWARIKFSTPFHSQPN